MLRFDKAGRARFEQIRIKSPIVCAFKILHKNSLDGHRKSAFTEPIENWFGPIMRDTSPKENSNYALEKLRDLLRHGGIGADGRLPTERTLSEKLGLSRRAIRRALEVLEAEGAIWRKQGSGTYAGQKPHEWSDQLVTIVAGTNFMEIMEVRLQIEPQMAQLAALRANDSDVDRMRELAQKILASEDADAKELWDGALHRQIAQAAGNQLFLSIFDVINRIRQDDAWQAIRERARSSANTMSISNAQHAAIIDAIASRNPERAGEAMRKHLLMLQERLIRQTSMDNPGGRSLGEAS